MGDEMKIEVSNGEIVDKYTILILKLSHCEQSTTKHNNIKKELDLIEDYVRSLGVDLELINKLQEVNRQLWEIEDRIRVMERESSFGREFVALARSVYKTNDIRFDLKSKINRTTESELHEEKILPTYN
jgi:hypothetical protein